MSKRMEEERFTKKRDVKYNISVMIIIFLFLFILFIPLSFIPTFFHELGHMIAMLIVYPGANVGQNVVGGYAYSGRARTEVLQGIFISAAGPIASFILMLILIIIVIPRVKKERTLLIISLWLMVFLSMMSSTGYLVQAITFEGGDTARIARDLNWLWGLGTLEGDSPIDAVWLLTIIGVVSCILIIYYAIRRFRDDMLNYFRDKIPYETRRERTIFTIKILILLPLTGGLHWLYSEQVANVNSGQSLIIGSWGNVNSCDLWGTIAGLIVVGVIVGILLGNKYITGKIDRDLSIKHSRYLLYGVIVTFFLVAYPYFEIIFTDDTYGPWDEHYSEFLPTSSGLFEFEMSYNGTTDIWSYDIRIHSDPKSATSNVVNLFKTPITWANYWMIGEPGTSVLMLPNKSLWVFTYELPDLRVDPNGNYTLYGTFFNFSSVDIYNPPSSLAWTDRIPINYTGEIDLYGGNSKAYFNPDTGEIWLIYQTRSRGTEKDKYGSYLIIDSSVWFARINPNTSSIISNQILDIDYTHTLLHKNTEIIFTGNDTLLIHSSSDGIEVTQAYNFFSSKDTSKTIYSKRDDEYIYNLNVNGTKLLVTSRFNRDLWNTLISITGNYETLNSRIRMTSDYPYNYIETVCYYQDSYYMKSYQYDTMSNEIFTTHYSNNGLQWTKL
jgi:hypothetical protein